MAIHDTQWETQTWLEAIIEGQEVLSSDMKTTLRKKVKELCDLLNSSTLSHDIELQKLMVQKEVSGILGEDYSILRGKIINYYRSLRDQRWERECKNYPRHLNRDQEFLLISLYQKHQARDDIYSQKLTSYTLSQILKSLDMYIENHSKHWLPNRRADLRSAGREWALKALDGFDLGRNYRLITFANNRIRDTMADAWRDLPMIKIPEELSGLRKQIYKLWQINGPMTDWEMAIRLHTTEKKIVKAKRSLCYESFDVPSPGHDTGALTLHETFIPEWDSKDVVEARDVYGKLFRLLEEMDYWDLRGNWKKWIDPAAKIKRKRRVSKTMTPEKLAERNKNMIYDYYGLWGSKPLTADEIIDIYGISRQGFFNIVHDLMSKLRAGLL